MAKTEDLEKATKVTVTNEFDESIGEWRAASLRPKFEALGINAGQSLDRVNSQLKKHFQGEPFVIVEKLSLRKDLQERVDALQRDLDIYEQVVERLERVRLPLAKDLQRYGLMQKQAADLVRLSATWLGTAAKRADTDLQQMRKDNGTTSASKATKRTVR